MIPARDIDAEVPKVGIGLRGPHMAEVAATRPAISWLEVHAENYMDAGPLRDRMLDLRRDYPLSLHGVGLSLGSANGIDWAHLARLEALAGLTEPMLVSEHLSWSVSGGVYLNDLLPLPYTEESLDVVSRNVEAAQAVLGRKILVENPSRYLRFHHSTIREPQFLAELARRTGCGILCDVNNIHVSCANLGGSSRRYLADLPAEAVGEIHLAGHTQVVRNGRTLLIDDHGSPVSDEVWGLYELAVARFGAVPSLIEWDRNLPDLDVLLGEARHAELQASNVVSARALAS